MVRFIAKWLKGTEMTDVLLQFSNASFTHSLAREMHVVNARWRKQHSLCLYSISYNQRKKWLKKNLWTFFQMKHALHMCLLSHVMREDISQVGLRNVKKGWGRVKKYELTSKLWAQEDTKVPTELLASTTKRKKSSPILRARRVVSIILKALALSFRRRSP